MGPLLFSSYFISLISSPVSRDKFFILSKSSLGWSLLGSPLKLVLSYVERVTSFNI